MPELVRQETLADLFAATVASRGDAIALADELGTLSYSELNETASRVAAALRERGAGAGRFVGLWMPRGRDVLIAQIAITMSGAAWLPFDADTPLERVQEGLRDLDAIGVIVPAASANRLQDHGAELLFETLLASEHSTLAPASSATDPAYVIYTSGSSGKPKGVLVTHQNICHFLRAAAITYGLGPDDIMLQAGSVAFDLSLEEIWLPFFVGAGLRICPADVLADPERLAALIRDNGVTALDVVPTLLGLIDDDLPSVRLIIVGGEACAPEIAERFATPGRTFINSYGPSEATVVATAAAIRSGQPITIGKPLPNMSVYVVDEQLRLMERGREGELLLGGPGVAKGYVNRPDLTAEKFIPNPFGRHGSDPVLYRSGDAVLMTDGGDLVFRGRVDDQVKIRGFRVELGEIEARLAREPGIGQAAVALNNVHGVDQLAAFVVLADGNRLDAPAIKASLARQLPPYMVPSIIEPVDVMPRLAASGKIDRKALAARTITVRQQTEDHEQPRTAVEGKLLDLAHRLFAGQPVGLGDDFFLDLGGHSLLAAQFISAARQDPELGSITLGMIYDRRSLANIAESIEVGKRASAPATAEPDPVAPPAGLRRFWCGLAQLATMPFLLLMQAAPWLAIFISYVFISGDEATVLSDIGLVFVAFVGINMLLAFLALGGKWLIIGRTRPGRYPLWGFYYFRLWLVQRILSLVHLKWMQSSPVLPLYLRALGAKVGRDVLIADFDAGAIDLLEFGDHASTGSKTVFANARVSGGWVHVGRISLGKDVAVGSSCAIEGDVEIGEAAEIADLTSLSAGSRIGAGEVWAGAPAAKVGTAAKEDLLEPPPQTALGRAARGTLYAAMLLVLPAISILPIVPAFRLMEWLDTFINPLIGVHYLWYMPVLALSASAGLITLTLLLIVACRWLLLPKVRPGRYSVPGFFYLRRWAMGLLVEAALDTLSSLFATLYMRAWYRLMGCRIGKGTEISTNFAGRYELIKLGAGNFIADDVVLGDDHLRRNWLVLDEIETGDQVFIGNEAVVPQGYVIESNSLIGVRSRPPEGGKVGKGETWFGSPPIELPTRQRFHHDERATFKPPRRLIIGRALFEAFNISLPTSLFITMVTIVMEVLAPVFDRENWGKALWICVLASVILAIVQLVVAVAYKWLLMGRYRPTIKPMWSWWALRTEAVAVMYWGMAGKALLDVLRGTPFLPLALRLFGVKTGKGIYLDSADITEFDCVTIGDDAVVNSHGCLQTHLYEDRLMKVGKINVGKGAVVGAGSTVLYDTTLGENARLGPLTLVMKGEAIPRNSRFEGSPARPS